MNDQEYKNLFKIIEKMEHDNKHSKLYSSKEMEGKIKKMIQNSVKPEV